jgi:hypothetical protein
VDYHVIDDSPLWASYSSRDLCTLGDDFGQSSCFKAELIKEIKIGE